MLSNITKCSLSNEKVYTQIYHESHKDSYVSYIRGKRCTDEHAFFCEISSSFQFPYYFGMNWAALDECLCDLEWLKFNSIFIVIDDFSAMFGGKKKLQECLIKYFKIMIDYWKKNDIPVTIWLNN